MSDRDVITVEGDSVTLRATGVGRYVEAVVLGVWIVFWAIGEAFALAVVGSMMAALFGFLRDSELTRLGRSVLDRAPGFEIGFMAMFLFLMVWLALWTAGGLAALYSCVRLLAGSDRLTVTGDELELTWHAGPVHRTHHFDRNRLRRIRIRSHDKAVVADMVSGTITLTNLGTVGERASVCDWLRHRLGLDAAQPRTFDPLSPPLGWRTTRGDSGAIHLSRPTTGRFTVAAIMAAIAAVALYAWYVDIHRNGLHSLWPGVVIALLSLAAAWVAWAREEWIARDQQLEYRMRFGPLVRERRFRNAHFQMTSHTDSDGDTRYKLLVRDDAKKRTIASSIFDDTEVVDCARWMEAATGFRLVK
jgi:hypothetical protein